MPSAAMATYERRRQRLLSRRRFAVRGCRDPFLLPHRTPAQAGPTAVSITSSSSSATRRGQMILSGRGLSIQNDSGLAQGLAHHSAAGSGCGKLTGGKLGSPGEDPTKVTQLKWRSHTSFFVEAARTWMANISAFARVFRRAMSGHDGASDKD